MANILSLTIFKPASFQCTPSINGALEPETEYTFVKPLLLAMLSITES